LGLATPSQVGVEIPTSGGSLAASTESRNLWYSPLVAGTLLLTVAVLAMFFLWRERALRAQIDTAKENQQRLDEEWKSYQPDEVLTDKSGCCAVLPALCAAAFPSVSTS
jgi:hypothetical protein